MSYKVCFRNFFSVFPVIQGLDHQKIPDRQRLVTFSNIWLTTGSRELTHELVPSQKGHLDRRGLPSIFFSGFYPFEDLKILTWDEWKMRLPNPKTNSQFAPEKNDPWNFGDSYWKPSFLQAMLVSGTGFCFCFCPSKLNNRALSKLRAKAIRYSGFFFFFFSGPVTRGSDRWRFLGNSVINKPHIPPHFVKCIVSTHFFSPFQCSDSWILLLSHLFFVTEKLQVKTGTFDGWSKVKTGTLMGGVTIEPSLFFIGEWSVLGLFFWEISTCDLMIGSSLDHCGVGCCENLLIRSGWNEIGQGRSRYTVYL